MKQKIYAVRQGRQPGLYESWEDCRAQVIGFPGALFKSFGTREEAEAFLKGEPPLVPEALPEGDLAVEIYVDGSFRADTGEFSYGMVVLEEGEEKLFKEKFSDPDQASMRNVAGEIRGAMAAMAYALEQGYNDLYLYYDYAGICHWCTEEWKANKPGTIAYRDYCRGIRDLIRVHFRKVKGHSHNHYNDLADRLAKEALDIR